MPATVSEATVPEATVSEALRLLADPTALEERLASHPEQGSQTYTILSAGLAEASMDELSTLQEGLALVARAYAQRLAKADREIDDSEIARLGAMQLVNPRRFVGDPAFRARALAVLRGAYAANGSPVLRDRLLTQLRRLHSIDFDQFEEVAAAWGAIPRESRERHLAAAPTFSIGDALAPIAASLYSLPSSWIDATEARSFLAAVRAVSPKREILVLADSEQRQQLQQRPEQPKTTKSLELLPTWGVPYSPWPRDPLSFLRAADGGLVAVLRPNVQNSREFDLDLGRALVQALPERLDQALGRLSWWRAETPFHNGQILFAAGTTWITLHTLEVRILELLGLERVPVDGFAEQIGARYVDAAHRAADELAELYGQPVRFIHPMPAEDATPQARAEALLALGGGAGFDLDSLVTLLETEGKLVALVADPSAGKGLLDRTSNADLLSFADLYGIRREALGAPLATAQDAARARFLGAFLDVMAEHLASAPKVARVERLPLLLVPYNLLDGTQQLNGIDFLVGWNNVVLERRGDQLRAEGFASGLARGDTLAHEAFARAGHTLDLLPPLTGSVLRNGGYRCASQHIRQVAAEPSH